MFTGLVTWPLDRWVPLAALYGSPLLTALGYIQFRFIQCLHMHSEYTVRQSHQQVTVVSQLWDINTLINSFTWPLMGYGSSISDGRQIQLYIHCLYWWQNGCIRNHTASTFTCTSRFGWHPQCGILWLYVYNMSTTRNLVRTIIHNQAGPRWNQDDR